MPRFSAAFSRRKSSSAAEEFQNVSLTAPPAPDQSSFRVLERHDHYNGKSFDGGARMARGTTFPGPQPYVPNEPEDNMFAGLNTNNRGSGASHTTKGTSNDASSRHSNVSTAPSSADMAVAHANDEARFAPKKSLTESVVQKSQKSGGSGFLNKAGRTFSFGMQKKNSGSATSPTEETIPDVPPLPTIQAEDEYGRARGLTTSTTSTATAVPPKLESGSGLDMGGDFGSMFSTFDKRASGQTLRNDGSSGARALTGNRSGHPAPLGLDNSSSVDPAPQSWDSQNSNDNLMGSPPVPRHQTGVSGLPDEDSRFLEDSWLAGRFLAGDGDTSYNSGNDRWRSEEERFSVSRKPIASSMRRPQEGENMFESTFSRFSRPSDRRPTRAASPPRKNKVMTPAEFEKYRQEKERQARLDNANKPANEEDEDEVNYDDGDSEDELEKSRQQAKQRRKQQAHMAVYRQQMMKVTGESAMKSPSPPPARPSLQPSASAPLISKHTDSTDDEDEDVPLAILQAHGFPNKNKPPVRLSNAGSNPNLRAAAASQPARPSSAAGDVSSTNHQRSSTLPAFARGLPQDPFVGAGIAKPAVRESLSFAGGSQHGGQMHPGGLVGVIASEERSRAMRRGSPNPPNNAHGQGHDPMGGMPAQSMYGMPTMAPPMLTPGDQAQIHMSQQMQQFMQMQMQFMQMMAGNQQGGQPQMQVPQMPQMGQMPQAPYGGLMGSQSTADLSSRQSMAGGEFLNEPRQLNANMRTMSMMNPGMQLPNPGYAGSFLGGAPGYTPSIAPSERSNVGLPGRYRPVTAGSIGGSGGHTRTSTMSGALSQWDDSKSKSTVKVVSRAGSDDEDDEEGWEAMKAAREKKKAQRKSKKSSFMGAF